MGPFDCSDGNSASSPASDASYTKPEAFSRAGNLNAHHAEHNKHKFPPLALTNNHKTPLPPPAPTTSKYSLRPPVLKSKTQSNIHSSHSTSIASPTLLFTIQRADPARAQEIILSSYQTVFITNMKSRLRAS